MNVIKKILASLALALAAIVAFLLGRKSSSSSGGSIEKAADAEIEKKREEIKKDSDQALADRFNRLTKKEDKKP